VTPIYHITHVGNLPGILQRQQILGDAEARREKAAAVVIGHAEIKDRRLDRSVPCAPGGCLGDYVPFYFAPRSPMLCAIYHGAVDGYDEGQNPVIHIASSAERVRDAGLPFAFTNGHAAMQMTDYFTGLDQLPAVDWALMTARYWADTQEDPDRKRRRQAEFLVKGGFPWELVDTIGTRTRKVAALVEQHLASGSSIATVEIRPGWYY
jgi:ssDNA thymidine ADP-ribosyltransferase, DarT